jgi:ribosomal-protein-alanine N-acetyltransferase
LAPAPSEPRIRPCEPVDVPRVWAIEAASFPEPWSEATLRAELANPLARLLVCVVGEPPALVGFALFWLVADEVHLHQIAVDPGWRRRGLARRLLAALEREGRAAGATLVDLEVRAGNTPARALYAALGFAEVTQRRRYYADGEDAVVLRKALAGDPAPAPSGGA